MSVLGCIACGSEQSAAAGEAMLRAGGNAFDAAIAAVFATAAGDAAITSLAGGGVMVARRADTGEVEVCNFFNDAPGRGGRRHRGQAVTPLDFRPVEIDFGLANARQTFHVGRGSAAVPGVIPGLLAALELWGSLPLSSVVEPAVGFLRDGIRLTPYQSACLGVLEPILGYSEVGRRLFFRNRRDLLGAGELYRNPDLAETLLRLGRGEARRLYDEHVGPAMLEGFGEESGGWLTTGDLAAYRPEFTVPLRSRYRGVEIATAPRPAFGGWFVSATMELFDRTGVSSQAADAPERYRRMVAVFRAISEVRAEVPDVVERSGGVELLGKRVDAILRRAPPETELPEPSGGGNTTHVSVVDRRGNAAGVTVSHGEGSGLWIGETGLHMNNVLGEEDLFPAGLHTFAPGERLPTMMTPTILLEPDGAITVLGSGGSNRIRTAISQVISALVDDGLDAASAVARGRIHYESGVVSAESYALPGGAQVLRSSRAEAGETRLFDGPSLFFGGVHLVRRGADGSLSGAGDLRRGGVARVVRGP